MLIKIHARGFALPDDVKQHTDAKVRLVLGLYFDKIRRVDVFLTDVNGPKGGEDMVCKMKVEANGHSSIVVQKKAVNIREAIDICAHGIKRSAARRFDRITEHVRARFYPGELIEIHE